MDPEGSSANAILAGRHGSNKVYQESSSPSLDSSTPANNAPCRPGTKRKMKDQDATRGLRLRLDAVIARTPYPRNDPKGSELSHMNAWLLRDAWIAAETLEQVLRRPPVSMRAASRRRLDRLVKSVVREELRDHGHHPRGRPCLLRPGRLAQIDFKDLAMLGMYVAGAGARPTADHFGLHYSPQGFRDAIRRPIRRVMRHAHWEPIFSRL